MIDVHCHAFNVRSLPLGGIFRSRKVPEPLASILAVGIKAIATDDRTLDVSADGGANVGLPGHGDATAVARAVTSSIPILHQSHE